ncbi:hypothetical protein ACFLW5_01120 [Chloroflexota bacterium]
MRNKLTALGVSLIAMLLIFSACAKPDVEPADQPEDQPEVQVGVELKHEDGNVDSSYAIGTTPGTGYLVHFSPPSTPFTIDKIKIFGRIYGIGYNELTFVIEVWDKDLKEIGSASYPHQPTFVGKPTWAELDIPDVVVNDDFYIHVFTHSPREGGVKICYNSGVPNEHSETTLDGKIDWHIPLPKETTNWLIRVIGE